VRFRIEQRFGAPLAAVENALCEPAFIEGMASLPKLGRPQLVSHRVDGDWVYQQVRYAFVGDLSSAVRRVVDPAKLTWVEDSATDRTTHRATFKILPDHYAGLLRCNGTFTLTAVPSGASRVAEGDMVVSVPLVGSKVERAIISGLEDHAREEAGLVEEWVASHD
jgi:uncharacterized protein DUF2505